MTPRFRIALVIALLLSAVVNLTAVEGHLGRGVPFGQPSKSRIEVSQARASLVRDTARRFKSAAGRTAPSAAWLQIADFGTQIRCQTALRITPRSASSFPPHWDSRHLNI
jgi:hypothetical protein